MILKNGKELRWGTYAMFIYCERNGVDLEGLLGQLSSMQFNLKTFSALVQAAHFAANKSDWEVEGIFQWVDECGGIFAKEGELIDFANYVVNNTIVKQSEPIEVEAEKKS